MNSRRLSSRISGRLRDKRQSLPVTLAVATLDAESLSQKRQPSYFCAVLIRHDGDGPET
jgi:hypothetical protein